ncbi:hypothetical protein LZ30DRAFT_710147 [Colletotrichum cereale]|nr:hypothetical protein LZ30DRAFT_710147 [Colletotrichum cereale]
MRAGAHAFQLRGPRSLVREWVGCILCAPTASSASTTDLALQRNPTRAKALAMATIVGVGGGAAYGLSHYYVFVKYGGLPEDTPALVCPSKTLLNRSYRVMRALSLSLSLSLSLLFPSPMA